MVGRMAGVGSRERVGSLMDAVSFAGDIPSKLHYLRLLRQDFSLSDPLFLSHYLPALLKLHSDHFSPVRKFVTQMIGEIVSRHSEHLAEIVPMLTVVIDDDTPAVARQAISCGTDIFRCTLEKVAVQGLRTSELDDSLELAWACVLKLKEKIYSIAFQPGSDGRRLVALKFVEMIVLIYTPDPNGSQEPPPHQVGEGSAVEFNISWVRKGHPILKFGDLSIEARQSLGLLLDQLRMPNVKSLSTSVVVVLINCLSAIAKRRPSFYGRILPVLLGLESSNSVFKAVHAYGVQHALKNAFLSCLKCTHASATPWRDRLVAALREMKVGGLAGQALGEVCSINVNVKENKDDAPVIKEEKSLVEGDGLLHDNKGRKRTGDLEFAERREDDLTPGKRIKSMPAAMAVLTEQSNADHTAVEGKTDSSGHATAHNDGDSGPVHQLVALFGALVAQGEKAIASLEILISSISADLLAEVVIANMRYLPSTCPKTEADEKPPITTSSQSNVVDSDTPFGQLSSFLSNALSSESSQQKASVMDVQPEAPDDIQIHSVEELQTVTDGDILCAPANEANENAATSSNVPHTSISYSTSEVKVYSADTSEFQDTGAVDAVIPGLDSVPTKGLPDTAISSALASTDVDGGSIDQVTSSGKRSQIDSLPSISTERSEELSSKTVSVDPHGGITSTATSLAPVQQFSLPKMSAPVVDLAEEQRDQLQKLAFLRIVEAYKQVAMAGGLQLRFSLLAYLGVEFPLELDPWSIIQKHILSDYLNHEGHEFTLRVLYRLYGEAEEDRDFFSSTTATSVYEMFLHTVAETLRDSFPASDKSLNRLLAEVPYLPKSIIKLLECLCSPDSSDKNDSESHSGDRVTQGLSIVWSLIMLRPSSRDVLLKVALQSAVHHLEEVRMKAIRLVANKLYPLSSIALQIEEFAREKLLSAAEVHTTDTVDTEETGIQPPKSSDIELSPIERPAVDTTTKDMPQISELSTSGSVPTALITEAQRCTSLYFALCTKKHSLLRQIFSIYKSSPWYIKKEVHRHMPILIRTVGASPTLLEIISDPPDGSDGLLMQVLHTLTDGTIPPPELIASIQKLYESRIKDVEILFPILPFLPKEEVLRVFPRLVNLPADKFLAALACLTQASSPTGPVLGPSEILIAIHGIDPDRDRIPLKKVTDACNACFEQKQTFTQQVIAKVLNQLVEQIPLPFLFMRTVLQATGAFPALVDFIMEILSRLVSKQIWKSPKLWVGFLKCAAVTQPHSFSVLLQLPPAQLENALTKTATLKASLAAHASQPDIKATLPRSILLVLGIAPESQPPSQAETSQTEAGDAASSDKDMRSEKSKESSGAS